MRRLESGPPPASFRPIRNATISLAERHREGRERGRGKGDRHREGERERGREERERDVKRPRESGEEEKGGGTQSLRHSERGKKKRD